MDTPRDAADMREADAAQEEYLAHATGPEHEAIYEDDTLDAGDKCEALADCAAGYWSELQGLRSFRDGLRALLAELDTWPTRPTNFGDALDRLSDLVAAHAGEAPELLASRASLEDGATGCEIRAAPRPAGAASLIGA